MPSTSSCFSPILPLLPYLLATLVLNVGPMLLGTESAKQYLSRTDYTSAHEFCNATNESWLFFNTGLTLVNIIGAFYFVCKVRNHYYRTSKHQQQSNSGNDTSLDEPLLAATGVLDIELARDTSNNEQFTTTTTTPATPFSVVRSMDYVICFDTGMTVYFCLASVWCIWQFLGVWLVYRHNHCDITTMTSVLRSGLLYMSLTSASLSAFLVYTSGMEHPEELQMHQHPNSGTAVKQTNKNKSDKKQTQQKVIIWLSQ